jgi:sialate O-acetylesterase
MLSLDNRPKEDINNSSKNNFYLDGYFGDFAVFQRNKIIPVSGYAKPESIVELKFGKISARTLASFDGRFTINIPPMEVAWNLDLYLYNEGREICCKNISVGEVYLLSGQSNMEFSLKNSIPGAEEITPEDIKAIRYFKIPPTSYYGKQTTLQGKWQTISKEDADKISGCGFFFGSYIAKNTNYPVGLINASLGGMNLETFVSKETLLNNDDYRDEVLSYEEKVSQESPNLDGTFPKGNEKISQGLAKLFPKVPDTSKEEALYSKVDYNDQDWDSMYIPDTWTEAGHNHAGIFCFRKTIEIPENFFNKDLEIHLGAIDKADKVYFNGSLIGQTGNYDVWDYWNTPRVYTIPAKLVNPKNNTLTIFAGSLASICMDGGLLGPKEEMYIKLLDNSNNSKVSLAGLYKYKEIYDAGTIGMTFMRSLGSGFAGSFHMLYDNMIYPLSNIPMRGVVWYQGEANGICMAKEYEKLLLQMLENWRATFGNSQLEFYIIQLPDYHNPHYFAPYNQWNLIREAQNNVAQQDKYTDCIVTLGWGDVTNLHPTNKKDVGYATGKFALSRLNGNPLKVAKLKNLTCQNNELILTFEEDILPQIGSSIDGFAIAGNDNIAYKANAQVTSSNTIKVSANEVANPTSTWYAWAGNPVSCNFYTKDGIKVSPFRATLNGNAKMAIAKNLIP